MHSIFKILFLVCVFLFVLIKIYSLIYRHKNLPIACKKSLQSHIMTKFDPHKDFDSNFLGLMFIFVIFFLFFSLSIFWVLSIEGINLVGFWAFIIGFAAIICSYFYMDKKGILDL